MYFWSGRRLQGRITIGTLIFLTGAIAGASTQLQGVFSLFSHIADQALFLTDLVDFLNVQPNIRSRPNALPMPSPFALASNFATSRSTIPARRA